MHVDHVGTLGAMHPPMVKAVAAGLGATGGRHRRALRALVGDFRAVHACRQQADSLREGGGEVAFEHGRRHGFVAIALGPDAADAELRVLGVPGIDLQVPLVAVRMAQGIRHDGQLQPFAADRFPGLPLAQEQHVGLHVGGRDAGKGALGQPDGAQQVGLRADVLARRVVQRIHRVAGGDEAHQPTGPHQVQRSAEEVVVDAEAGVGPVAQVGDLVLAEGHVADHEVEPVVGQRRLLERCDADIDAAGRIERSQHPSRQPVDLDGGHLAALGQGAGHRTDEVADAGGGFEDAPAGEAEAFDGLPHRLDHVDRAVVAVVHRGPGRLVIVVAQQAAQLLGAPGPGLVVGIKVEAGRQAAPAGVAHEPAALGREGCSVMAFDMPQRGNGIHVRIELGHGATQLVEVGLSQCRPQDAWCGFGDDPRDAPGGVVRGVVCCLRQLVAGLRRRVGGLRLGLKV